MNYNKFFFVASVVLSSALIISCGGNKKEEAPIADSATVAAVPAENTVDELVDFKFHYLTANIPSPMELVDALPVAGIPFNKEILNAKENESKYLTSMKKALNFGVYSVDMAYLTTYEEYGMIKGYMGTSRSMAKSLDLTETFDKVVGQRLSGNSENKDSLRKIVDEAYFEVDNYMKNNERALASTEMLTGSWVESQYITLNMISKVERSEKNALLFDKVFEQKRHLASLVSLLKEYENEKDLKPIIEKLSALNTVYTSMKTDQLNDKKYMAMLAEKITEIRKMIVS